MDELFTAVYTAGVVSLYFIGQGEIALLLSPILIMWLAFSLGLWNDDNEKPPARATTKKPTNGNIHRY